MLPQGVADKPASTDDFQTQVDQNDEQQQRQEEEEQQRRQEEDDSVPPIAFQTTTGEKIPKTSAPSIISDKELFECDHIPLHLIGHIQGNTGNVIFVSFPLGQIVAVDANIRDLEWIRAPPGAPQGPRALLGTPLSAWVPRTTQQAIMRAMYQSVRNSLVRNFHFEQGYAVTVAMASTEKNLFAVEVERAEGEDVVDRYSDTLMYISKLVDFYANESIVNMACDTIFDLLPEYDRGMVYKFNEDLSGEIIHEVRRGKLDTTYLGHRFPKYDIPLSSRRLYIKNTLRYIRSSVESDVPMVSLKNQQVDLSHIRARSVAKPHLIYMQNMGVRCSMSMAIVVENELWGLFAFHGYARPYRPSLHQRIACEAIASMVSVRVESLMRKAGSARIVSIGECMQRWNSSKSFASNITGLGQEILDITEADVLVGSMDDEFVVVGDARLAPNDEFWQNPPTVDSEKEVVVCSSRQEIMDRGYSANDCPASGFVYFCDERTIKIFIGRAARATDIKWAGNPDQPKIRGLDGVLNPRNSFEIFIEKARRECKGWSTADLNVISVLQDRICTGQAQEWMTALLKSDIEEANMRYFSLLDRERDNSQFFAHMCHELRTPFHGIMGCLNLIHDSVETMTSDEIKDLVKTALGSGNHMINLLNDILNHSKNKYLSNQPVRHTLRFESLVEEVKAPFAVLARNMKVDFSFNYSVNDQDEDLVIALDRTKFIQVSTNIINNALKFADHGQVCGNTAVSPTLQKSIESMRDWSTRFDGFVFSMKGGKMLTTYDDARMWTEDYRNNEKYRWLCLTVSDFGSGMKASELEAMFEPYTQGSSDKKESRFASSGLGLFISVSLCHQLGGYIACLSTPNVGTTFHVGIPVELVHGGDAISETEDKVRDEDLETPIPLRGPILIVDDNKVNLKLLRLSLTKELEKANKHVDIISVDSGEDAVAKYREMLPSVVIIDYHMPGMNGLEATRAMRRYEKEHDVNASFILSYTADLSQDAHDVLVSSGSDGIMTKPPPRDFVANLVYRMEVLATTQVMHNYQDCANAAGSIDRSSSSRESM